MTTSATTFKPNHWGKALLDQLYDVKFSKHTPLVVVLLSMIYTVYRSADYLDRAFHLPWFIAWPTAGFMELLVLAASASVFIALRNMYIAELKQEDVTQSKIGLGIAGVALFVAFLALLFVAWADAYAVTQQYIPAIIMALIQFTQMLFMVGFIVAADLDEREKLRKEYADYARGTCQYCRTPVSANNRARHERSCSMRPSEG
jgi:hypothetical protein